MTRRALTIVAIVLVGLPAAGCHRKQPAGESMAGTRAPSSMPEPALPRPASEAPAEPAPEAPPALDTGALDERKDPDRVLRFYAAALQARDWTAAAKAWGAGSGVTATTLKASYDRAETPILELGKGEVEGAAGSLYYEAPVTLRFGAGLPERGSLVLRRVNDVDGATAEQLRWHIERSTIGQGQ